MRVLPRDPVANHERQMAFDRDEDREALRRSQSNGLSVVEVAIPSSALSIRSAAGPRASEGLTLGVASQICLDHHCAQLLESRLGLPA